MIRLRSLVSPCLALALAAAAGAQCLNVDINKSGSPNHSGTAVASDTGTVWNSFVAPSASISHTLTGTTDSEGNPLAATVTLSRDNGEIIKTYDDSSSGNPNPADLMREYLYQGPYTITVTDLDPGSYTLHVFAHGNNAGQNSTVTLDGANGGTSGQTSDLGNYRDILQSGAEGTSYLALDGTVGFNGVFTFSTSTYLNGFQLLRTSDATYSPTPAFNVDCGNTSYTGTAVAPDAGTTWNTFSGSSATSITINDVLASDGSTLDGVDVTISTTGSQLSTYANDAPGNPNPLNLMRDYYYGGSFTVEIDDLNAGNYQLHVFAHGDQANQNSTVTLDAANGGGSGTTDGSGGDNRDLFAAGAEGFSYLSFPATVGSGGALSFTATGYLTGFQLSPVPLIEFTTLPEAAVLADDTAHTLTAEAMAEEAVSYQWRFSPDGTTFTDVPDATDATLDLTASAETSGYYRVIASTPEGSITSPAVYFGLGSSESFTLAPANGALGIAIDQPLRLKFPGTPRLGPAGKLRVHDASNHSVVATIDRSTFQSYTIDSLPIINAGTQTQQGRGYFYLPIAVFGDEVWVTLSTSQRLSYGKTYYVTMDAGLLHDSANQPVAAITDPEVWSFSTREAPRSTPTNSGGPTIISVAMDGGGDFATLQGALDWIPQNNTVPRTILVEPGTYREAVNIDQNRRFITIRGTGETRDDVLFFHPAPAGTDMRSAGVISVESDDITLQNLTLDCGVYLSQPNPAGAGNPDLPIWPGRINVLYTTADRLVCENVAIKGGQDSLFTHSGICYFKQCEVWGSVDFIYGGALAVFDGCDIVQVRPTGGPICAPSTAAGQPHGLVFLDCRFPRALVADGYPHDVNEASTTFMRPWRKDGATEILRSELGSHFTTKAWSEWNGREATCRAREFGNTRPGGDPAPTAAERHSAGAYWLNTDDPDYNPASDDETDSDVAPPSGTGNRLTASIDPADYTLEALFGGWLPETGTVLFPNGYGSTATGGEGGTEVTVANAADLVTYATSDSPYIIHVEGAIDLRPGGVAVKSNKTIRGADENAAILGNLSLGGGVRNVIIRDLDITHPGTTIDPETGKYADGGDGVSIAGASHVVISHCTFHDCGDGACDISHGADYVTVEWCKFHYTTAAETHRFAMILGNTTSSNYHVTLHHNWFAEGCHSRMPSGSFSRAHLHNNYFSSSGNFYCTNVRVNGQFLVENNSYEGVNNPCYKELGGKMSLSGNLFNDCTGHPGGWDSTAGALTGNDEIFLPPYDYVLDDAAEVAAIVMAGAGNAPSVADPWAGWQTTHFSQAEIDAGDADPDANPDGDFLPNLGEYALGLSPLHHDTTPPPVRDGSGLLLVFQRPSGVTGVTLTAESSADLDTWFPVPVEVVSSGDPDTVRILDPLVSGDPSRRFIRLIFTRP